MAFCAAKIIGDDLSLSILLEASLGELHIYIYIFHVYIYIYFMYI